MTTSPVNPIQRKRRPSSFLSWAPLVEVLIVVMFLTSLYERAWSRAYAAEVRLALGQVARLSSTTYALRAELTHRYQKEAFEALGYQPPAREYIVAPTLSSVISSAASRHQLTLMTGSAATAVTAAEGVYRR